MFGTIITVVIGIVVILIGITNIKGNISSLHSYHRARVTPENILPFGKLVGIGTILTGISCILIGVFIFLGDILNSDLLVIVGMALSFVLMTIGIVITVLAIKKYNGGLF